MKAWATFVLGMLAGALVTMLAAGHQLDTSHLERRALQNKVLELQETITRLEATMETQKQQYATVQEVKVTLLEQPDPFAALELEEAARVLLEELIGKDVASLDLRLVRNLLEGRIIEVESKRYALEVHGIQLFRRVEVLLKPRLLRDSKDDEP